MNKYATLVRDVDSEGSCEGVWAGDWSNPVLFAMNFAINQKLL